MRPPAALLKNVAAAFFGRLITAAMRPRFLRPAFALLRRTAPMLTLGNVTIVSRYLDVVDVLRRDTDFTVSELNGPRINRLDGPFVLGLDRGPQYDRERLVLRKVVLDADLDTIAEIVRKEAAKIIAAAWDVRRIDIPNGYAGPIAVRVASQYFGVPVTDEAQFAGWFHDIFWDVFANVADDAAIRGRAARADAQLRPYLDRAIADRKATFVHGKVQGDVLGRMLELQAAGASWFDDDAIRRNLTGCIAGTLDNTSKFLTLAMAQLLRRPQAFARVREAALARDRETVRHYLYEAARFDPAAPLLARHVPRSAVLAAGTRRQRLVRSNSTLVLGNLSAMFDPDGFDEPAAFDPDHDAGRLHFGLGLHGCLGSQINSVQLPELAIALLGLSNLRPTPGREGALRFAGPFPDRFSVTFG